MLLFFSHRSSTRSSLHEHEALQAGDAHCSAWDSFRLDRQVYRAHTGENHMKAFYIIEVTELRTRKKVECRMFWVQIGNEKDRNASGWSGDTSADTYEQGMGSRQVYDSQGAGLMSIGCSGYLAADLGRLETSSMRGTLASRCVSCFPDAVSRSSSASVGLLLLLPR